MRVVEPLPTPGFHAGRRLPRRLPALSPSSYALKKFIQISVSGCLLGKLVSNADPVGWCENLYRAKASELILYGRALGLSHSEAEDVLQETFIALMQRPQPPELPEHYCLRAFRNRALNYRRSLWRRLTRELESARWFERAPAENPAERAMMRCLAALPRDQREVIVLKIWHKHTFQAIGELLEVSPNTAAGRYRYGLQKLRMFLKGELYERDERVGDAVVFLDAAPPLGEA